MRIGRDWCSVMPVIIITASLVIALGAYLLVAARERSLVHVLTPLYLIAIPCYFLFELLHIKIYGYSASDRAYLYCYVAYAVHFAVLSLAYAAWPSRRIGRPFSAANNIASAPYWLLALSVAAYLPVLWEFREYLFSPRVIYQLTRSGYGHYYFVSATLTFVAFILMLFKHAAFRGEKLLFGILCAGSCVMHGSKGQVLMLAFYLILYRACVSETRFGFWRAAKSTAAAGAVALSLFYALSPSQLAVSDVGQAMADYADYNRNAMMVIDDDGEPLGGKLTWEQAVYTRVPRVLYPAKPYDWGTYYLANKYYPAWHERLQGSPSFGIVGVPYADFGPLAILYLGLWAGLTGVLLKVFVVRLRHRPTPSDFIMVAFLGGMTVIPTGTGYTLVEHMVLALLVSGALRLRCRFGTSPIVATNSAVQRAVG